MSTPVAAPGAANQPQEKEPVSKCCGAPLYSCTVPFAADGRVDQQGVRKPVLKCMCCGEFWHKPACATVAILEFKKGNEHGRG